MGTFGQGPRCGTSLALGELNLELSSHSVEWGHLVTDHDVEPVQHWGTQPRAEWTFFEWRHLVSYQKMNKSSIGALGLGLRAILQENGGAWSVTKYLTLGQIMQPMADTPGLLSPRLGLGI